MNSIEFEIGKLIESVDNLTKKVTELEKSQKYIVAQMNKGKGIITGLMLAAGGIGAGVATVIKKWLL